MPLSSSDQNAVSQALEKIYAISDLDGYVLACMQVLPDLIDADVGAYNEVNYKARRIFCTIDSGDVQQFYHENRLVFERVLSQNPLIEHHAQIRDAPRRISDLISQEDWQSRRAFHDYYRHISGTHQIAVALTTESRDIIAFAFNRSQSDFSDRDVEILTVLQPHLTRAYQNALAHTQNLDRVDRREDMLSALGIGWLDLGPGYAVKQAAPEILETVRSFFQTAGSAEIDAAVQAGESHLSGLGRLPSKLEDWIDGQLRDGQSGNFPGRLTVTSGNRRLDLTLVMGEDGGISLMTDIFYLETSPDMLRSLGLGKRQAEVLYWVSQGKSNTEIAVILTISLSTVENHIHQILGILGVGNRTQAACLAQQRMSQK